MNPLSCGLVKKKKKNNSVYSRCKIRLAVREWRSRLSFSVLLLLADWSTLQRILQFSAIDENFETFANSDVEFKLLVSSVSRTKFIVCKRDKPSRIFVSRDGEKNGNVNRVRCAKDFFRLAFVLFSCPSRVPLFLGAATFRDSIYMYTLTEIQFRLIRKLK